MKISIWVVLALLLLLGVAAGDDDERKLPAREDDNRGGEDGNRDGEDESRLPMTSEGVSPVARRHMQSLRPPSAAQMPVGFLCTSGDIGLRNYDDTLQGFFKPFSGNGDKKKWLQETKNQRTETTKLRLDTILEQSRRLTWSVFMQLTQIWKTARKHLLREYNAAIEGGINRPKEIGTKRKREEDDDSSHKQKKQRKQQDDDDDDDDDIVVAKVVEVSAENNDDDKVEFVEGQDEKDDGNDDEVVYLYTVGPYQQP